MGPWPSQDTQVPERAQNHNFLVRTPAEPVIAGNPPSLSVDSRIQIPWAPPQPPPSQCLKNAGFESACGYHIFNFMKMEKEFFVVYIFEGICIPSMFRAFSSVCFVAWTRASRAFFVSSSCAVRTGWDS